MKNEKIILEAKKREVVGKKAKKLRKQGLILANIFGTDFKSQAITVDLKSFLKVYKQAKETGIVYLKIDKEELPVLIKNIQRHPVSDTILHVDFRKIDLKKKIETEVPIKIIGVSEAVTQKSGVLLTQTENLLIEALPEEIPQCIEIDISVLKEIGQEIKVSDLKKSDKYEIKTEKDKVIVSVVAHKEENITPDTTVAAPEVISEVKKEEEADSGEKTSENKENKTTEKKPEASSSSSQKK